MEDTHQPAPAEGGDPSDDFGLRFDAEREDLIRVCHRFLDDPSAVEDAVHEVFLRSRRAISTYDPEQPFRPWLRTIASNYCIDQLRRLKTERRLFDPEDLSEEGLADGSPSVLRRLVRLEERREVLSTIDALPARYRLPLVLRYYQDLDYQAIAELLGISRNQVGSLLFRAKAQLREQLAAAADDGSDDARERRGRLAASDRRKKPEARRRRRARSSSNSGRTKGSQER